GKELPLALGQAGAVRSDAGVVALGQAADKAVGVGDPGRPDDLLVGGVQLAEADVVGNGAGEQVGVLQHDAQGLAQGVLRDVPHVDAVVGDRAGVDVVK